MRKRATSKKTRGDAPSRSLVEVSSYRTTGGAHIENLTPYPAEYESHNEKLAIPILALCHDVQSVRSQNEEYSYPDADGAMHSYTPDFAIEREGSSKALLVEAKSLTFLLHKDSLHRYRDIASHFRKIRQPFAFIVDAQLMQQPLRTTANLLFRYITSTPPQSVAQRVKEILREGSVPISRVCHQGDLTLTDVYTLISKRHLCIDWELPLTKESSVSLPNKPYKGLCLEDFFRSTRHGRLLAMLALGRGTPDQRLMADAAAWRRTRRPLEPWNFAAGSSRGAPVRDVRADELGTGKSWQRGHRAPGRSAKPANS